MILEQNILVNYKYKIMINEIAESKALKRKIKFAHTQTHTKKTLMNDATAKTQIS